MEKEIETQKRGLSLQQHGQPHDSQSFSGQNENKTFLLDEIIIENTKIYLVDDVINIIGMLSNIILLKNMVI